MASGADEGDNFIDAEQLSIYAEKLLREENYQREFFMGWIAQCLHGPDSETLTEKEREEILARPFSTEAFFHAFADSRKSFLTQEGMFTEEEFSDNKPVIAKYFLQQIKLYYEYVMKDAAGNLLGAQGLLHQFSSTMEPPTPRDISQLPRILPQEALSYSDVVERYVAFKIRTNRWKEHNRQDNKNRLDYFLYIIGDKLIEAVTREDMHLFLNKLQKLPPNRTKLTEYAGKTVDEVIAMEPKKKLNVKTVNTITAAICSLFEWCVHEGILKFNPAKKLQIKDSRQALELREAFSLQELQVIFAHPKFSEGQFKYPAYFWIPLIGLYTGMRLEEIAQLHWVMPPKISSL